jgi:hypothetical protein
MISVNAEEDATADAQPNVIKDASMILSFSFTFKYSFRASPQFNEPVSPMALAPSSSPTFLGFKKCSMTFSE